MHIDRPMRTPDSHRFTTTNDSLSDGFGQRFDTVVSMTAICGQDEVVALPNDQDRIQPIMDGPSSAKYSLMAIDQSAVTSTRTKEPRKDKGRQYMQQRDVDSPKYAPIEHTGIGRAANTAADDAVSLLAVRAAG
jgi:hypothetical protein